MADVPDKKNGKQNGKCINYTKNISAENAVAVVEGGKGAVVLESCQQLGGLGHGDSSRK